MASADTVFPPSLPPSPSEDNTYIVQVLVFLAVLGMFLLHVLGSLRRRSSYSLLHTVVAGVYRLSYPLVYYTVGRMMSSDYYYNDFTVWAVFLLLLLGSTDSLTVFKLSDIDNWESIYVEHLFMGFLLVSIILMFGQDMEDTNNYRWLWYPLSAILFVVVLRSYVRIASLRMVSKSYLCKSVKVIAEYMEYKDNKLVVFDPVTMEGYGYMVAGENHCINRPGCTKWYKKDGLKVTTVEKIWQCKGNLLLTERKDLCLSMALSKMLNRRFAGFKLSEAELDKTHDFVFRGLLVGDERYQRAFRVIEEELVFVHGMYYTRYSYLYQKGPYLAPCLPVIMFALCWWLTGTSLSVKHQHAKLNDKDHDLKGCTIVITVVLALLEAYQLYLYIASGWFKVALIRSYVAQPFLQRSGYCFFEMIIDLLLRLKAFRPWKGRLGQYCILQDLVRKSWIRNCLHYATLGVVVTTKKGRKSSVNLSESVKKAIVDSLVGSNGHLTNGVKSLQNNGVHGLLSWACYATASDGGVARTIVVWHIATTLCEHQLDKQTKEEDAVKAASTLSKYCMHLLAFAPNLLPDHSFMSEFILDQSFEEARELLKDAKDKKIESRCEILMKNSTLDCVGDETRLVAQGAQLARNLIEGIQDSTLRWKVLSDFWAEMMLYVAPSDDARAHLELLARGGEFITHLWALLTHAGVLKRDHTGPNNVV